MTRQISPGAFIDERPKSELARIARYRDQLHKHVAKSGGTIAIDMEIGDYFKRLIAIGLDPDTAYERAYTDATRKIEFWNMARRHIAGVAK